MQTTTDMTANTGGTRPTPLAPLILGLGAALAITLAMRAGSFA